MKMPKALLIAMGGVVAFVALLVFLPGSFVWSMFNPPRTVTLPTPTQGPGGASPPSPSATIPPLQIITLLPRDAIPAIAESATRFVQGDTATAQMRPDDRVLGVSINGDHRAYSTAQLSSHEIVNDTIGGKPVAVTW